MRLHEAVDNVVVTQLNTARMNPFFIGRVVEVTEDTVVYKDAYSIIFNEEGTSFNLFQMNPLGGKDEEYEIPRLMIITIAEADDQFKQALTKQTSGIEIAGANSIPKNQE